MYRKLLLPIIKGLNAVLYKVNKLTRPKQVSKLLKIKIKHNGLIGHCGGG